jgi:hypothetical protein
MRGKMMIEIAQSLPICAASWVFIVEGRDVVVELQK